LFSSPGGTEMVHFPPLPSLAYEFSERYFGMSQSGFPHSEIPGSKTACVSPRLIAACHVLHRLLAPRHSPYALSSLTKCSLHLTALMWSKNYRLQSIQLSKNRLTNFGPPSRYALRRTTFAWLANRSKRSLASVCEGWWRIPGSNR
jgi:hypothetical protein